MKQRKRDYSGTLSLNAVWRKNIDDSNILIWTKKTWTHV